MARLAGRRLRSLFCTRLPSSGNQDAVAARRRRAEYRSPSHRRGVRAGWLRRKGGGVGRNDGRDAGNFLRMRRFTQPACSQPRFRHVKLGVAAIMANEDIGLRKNRRMAQRPRPVSIQPNLSRNKRKIFTTTFWTSHNTPQRQHSCQGRKANRITGKLNFTDKLATLTTGTDRLIGDFLQEFQNWI